MDKLIFYLHILISNTLLKLKLWSEFPKITIFPIMGAMAHNWKSSLQNWKHFPKNGTALAFFRKLCGQRIKWEAFGLVNSHST